MRETCGTYAGYRTHRRRGEAQCDSCMEAARNYDREYRRQNRDRLRRERKPRVKRSATQVRRFLNALDTVLTLWDSPLRDSVLNTLNPQDRNQFLMVEWAIWRSGYRGASDG